MRVWLAAGKVMAGLVVGLVLAELAFYIRSGGAFPHLNIYQADPELGVRLEPNAQLRLAFSGNPVTHVTTNSRGFRGQDWPDADRDVLVVGDSQVFGLGVEDSESFSAQLEKLLEGGHVLNAGVPTYGPAEYTALVERVIAERKPARVVYVLNMANDLFELERPNRERHAVWDGWAVRSETAPHSTVEYPGRRWLMSRSHTVYALRSWLRGLQTDEVEFASEGGFRDVVERAQAATIKRVPAAGSVERLDSERTRIADELVRNDIVLLREFSRAATRDRRYVAAMRGFGYQGDPRDIVQPFYTESARPVHATAFHLLFSALSLDKNAAALEALAKQSKQASLLAAIQQRRALREQLAKASSSDGEQPVRDALDEMLARTQRACDAVQAELMVVVLPLDVQVSPEEWKKYGQAPLDMSATALLNQDIVERAKRLGARALDATSALRAAQPGAFLQGDLHMSPRGHAALARAIAAAWREPLPPPAALPFGRSALPASDEWRAVEPVVSPGLPERCRLARVREWWRVSCRPATEAPYDEVTSIVLLRGGRGDAIADHGPRGTTPRIYGADPFIRANDVDPSLIAPVLEGDTFEVQLGWSKLSYDRVVPDHTRTLRVSWPPGQEPRAEWSGPQPPAAKEGVQPEAIHATINLVSIPRDHRCAVRNWSVYHRAVEAGDYAAADAFFEEPGMRQRELQCQLGKPLHCDPGETPFGVVGHCVPACGRDKPCAQGTCTADRGRFGCILP